MSRRCSALIIFWAAGLVVTAHCSARVIDSARMVSQDATLMLAIDSVDDLQAAFKQTYFHTLLFQEPSMKQFTAEARSKLGELFQQQLKALWRAIELEQPPKKIPLPHGRCILQLFVEPFEVTPKDTGGSRRQGSEVVPDMEFVLVADMGQEVGEARRVAEAALKNASFEDIKRSKKRSRGVELVILEAPENEIDLYTFCYGFRDSYLICGTSVAHTEKVITQMARGRKNSLAEVKGFSAVARHFADYHTFAYVQLEPIKALISAMAPTPTHKWQIENAIHQLGLGNVQGLALASRFAGERFENMRSSSLIVIEGPRTGVPALICPKPTSLKANAADLGEDVIMLAVANYDLPGMYDAICKMIKDTAGVDATFFTEGAMARTAQGDGRPPVNLRQDILGQMATPLRLSWRMDKPYTDPKNSRSLLSIPTHDGERLEDGLARVHRTFIAAMDPDLQRSMRDHALYLLPPAPIPSPFVPLQVSEEVLPPKQLAVTIADDHMVFAEADQVEQSIRSAGKNPSKPLSADPHFNHASRHAPAQASFYFYRNEQTYMEIVWEQALLLARQLSEELQNEEAESESSDLRTALLGLRKSLDYRKLPEYQTIKKYIGPRIGYINEHPLGILMEEITLKPRR